MKPVIFLAISNLFMTVAWYGHLKFTRYPMWLAIVASWLIAGLEYCFQVPGNRIGYMEGWSASELKITQEMITLVVFCLFAVVYLGEKLRWNHYLGFGLVMLAVFVVHKKW